MKKNKKAKENMYEKNSRNVSDDTLEFLSLDDEVIEEYMRKTRPQRPKKRMPLRKQGRKQKQREIYEEEDYEIEELEEIEDEDEEVDYEEAEDGEAYYADEDEEEDDEAYYADEDEEEDDEAYYADEDEEEDDEAYYADEEEDDEAYYADEEEDDEAYYADEEEDDEAYYADEDEDEDDEAYYADDDEDEDDEFYYEDMDDEEEDDEEEEDEDEYESIFTRFAYFVSDMSSLDRVVAIFGCVILAAAIVTGVIYAGAKMTSRQVAAFNGVGSEIEQIGVIGESGLLAVSTAESSRLSQMVDVDPETGTWQEGQTPETETGPRLIEVGINLTSIQADIKIKFVNKATNKLIGGIPFEVEVAGDNGKVYNLKDEDKDGIIYQTGVAAGTYTVKVVPLQGGEYETYRLPSQGETVKVTDTITYKKVDVADEIKTEAEVNVAIEDTAVQDTAVESTLKDTVEWVESTKTELNADGNYQEIKKEDIPNPALTGKAGTFVKTVQGDGNDSGNGSKTEGEGTGGSDTGTGTGGNESGTDTSEGGTTGGDGSGTETGGDNTEGGGSSGGNEGGTTPVPPENPDPPKPDVPPTPTEPTDREKLDALNPQLSGVTLKKGESRTLSLSVSTNESYSVAWGSGNSSIVSISGGNTATVTGAGIGSTTVSATVSIGGASTTVSCTVVVTDIEYQSLTVTGSGNIKVGKTGTVVGTTNPAGGTISWSSSDERIVKVDQNGVMTGVSSGTATITGVCGNAKGTWTVTVVSEKEYKSLTVTGSGNIKVGKTGTVVGTTDPAGGVVSWSSSDEKIVKVDKNGVMTGVSAGTATITGVCENAKGTWTVTVVSDQEYKSLTVTGSGNIQVGKTGTVKGTTDPAGGVVTWTSDNEKIVTVNKDGVMTGVSPGTATITGVCGNVKGTWKVTVVKDLSADTTTKLKDKNGNQIYVKSADGKYIEATYADYYKDQKLYLRKAEGAYSYTGWQVIDGYTYFFDKNGNYVTGEQVIQGAKYSFGSDGRLSSGSGTFGIDVSRHNGNIDWNAVKNSGVSYVIIRCGYRGSTTGALIEDTKFASNIQGAKAAGLKVGVYFVTQAVNEVEAVEEASMALKLISGYGLNYPVFLDVEPSRGRGDKIDIGTRTAVCKAFCSTIQNSGYSAGIYANKTWFTTHINAGSLTGYKIWLAQYAEAPTYNLTRYDMWQYSSKGKVTGINGDVDLNISYMNY